MICNLWLRGMIGYRASVARRIELMFSLGLINAALKAGQEAAGKSYDELVLITEHLNVRKLVAVSATLLLSRIIQVMQLVRQPSRETDVCADR